MHIGLLLAGHMPEALSDTVGDYPDLYGAMLAPHAITCTAWDVTAGELPEGPRAAEGWLISGSRHGAYDDLPWVAPLEDFMRSVAAAGVPLLGICFGHQIVAQALGGRVEKWKGGWTLGPTPYAFADGTTYTLNAWHQDQVTAPPEAARTIATAPGCAHAALAIGETILTVQPHPEFRRDAVAGLLETRGTVLPPESAADLRARLDRPTDEDAFAARLAGFFRSAATADRRAGAHVA